VDEESSGAPCRERERESKRGGRKKREPQMAEI